MSFQFLGAKFIHVVMKQIFRTLLCKTETLYLLNNNSLSTPSIRHLVNYHSTFCFYEFDYVSHLLWVDSYISCFVRVKVIQSCLTVCNPMDYKVHGILQARILEWVAFPFSRESSQPRDWTRVSHTTGWFFTSWATRKAQEYWSG